VGPRGRFDEYGEFASPRHPAASRRSRSGVGRLGRRPSSIGQDIRRLPRWNSGRPAAVLSSGGVVGTIWSRSRWVLRRHRDGRVWSSDQVWDTSQVVAAARVDGCPYGLMHVDQDGFVSSARGRR
jgi:hypothetical protein